MKNSLSIIVLVMAMMLVMALFTQACRKSRFRFSNVVLVMALLLVMAPFTQAGPCKSRFRSFSGSVSCSSGTTSSCSSCQTAQPSTQTAPLYRPTSLPVYSPIPTTAPATITTTKVGHLPLQLAPVSRPLVSYPQPVVISSAPVADCPSCPNGRCPAR